MPSESAPSSRLPIPPRTPGELARETLKVLASRRIAPTPENYVRVYAEIAGTSSVPAPAAPAAAEPDPDWSQVIRDLLRQLDVRHAGVSLAQKRDGLERLLINFRRSPQLGEKLASMVKAWGEPLPSSPGLLRVEAEPSDAPDAVLAGAPAAAPAPWRASPVFNGIAAMNPPAAGMTLLPMVEDLAQALRELLAGVFEREVAPRVSDYPKLAGTVSRLPPLVRAAVTPADCAAIDAAIGHALREAELAQVEQRLIVEDSMALVRMLVANLAELVDDDRWVAGQVQLLEQTVAQPPSSRTLADAQAQFRETVERQRELKQALREMKRTLKELIAVFVERVGEMAQSAVDYQARMLGYTERVRVTDNVNGLRDVLDDLMVDIRRMQVDATRSRDGVLGVGEQAARAQGKVVELEAELARVSAALREDALTGALNRRGLDEAVEREASRAHRYGSQLCFAMIDLDNFKKLNDRLGHQAGDEALRYLVSMVRGMLRPSDTVGRYGGEEFVLLLPETPLEDAKAVVERLQRELTRQFFLHDNKKVLITFSAGVSRMQPGEPGAEALLRADQAMYRAKRKGRNRVMLAGGD
ncbi:MAG: diguanylate cyclase [Proteobacteria bacterium]|nr:diguanylate cyclase [Pseudomonadota bacterium]